MAHSRIGVHIYVQLRTSAVNASLPKSGAPSSEDSARTASLLALGMFCLRISTPYNVDDMMERTGYNVPKFVWCVGWHVHFYPSQHFTDCQKNKDTATTHAFESERSN
ncbi:hypothetical protein ACRALDRAFT_208754 [Sodiomyces alcalophilus JCM 7366]|uniref:uncharacterized protein n=1 Tax=Sodiomyces alcalophilus JCM 7366 TaxID=591952 RepID=UPI0039B6055A